MKLEKKEISEILNNWNLGKLISFEKTAKGVVNHNWICKTSKGKYILRGVVFHKKLSYINFELGYLNYLKKKGFGYKIPAPIKTKEGKFLIKYGKNYIWVYEFIEGRIIKKFEKPHLKEIAKMMAKYHYLIEKSKLNNGKGKGNPYVKNILLKELGNYKSKILRKNKRDIKDRIFLKEFSKVSPLLQTIKTEEYAKLPRYPLHRDINPENTIWNKGRLIGVIDFENVSEINEPLIKDVVGMLQYSCRDRKYKHKLDLKLIKFFLEEYKKHHSLGDKEIGFIPDIITAGAIEDFAYQYWMWLNDPKRAKLYRLKLYSQVAQWSNKNKNWILEKLS